MDNEQKNFDGGEQSDAGVSALDELINPRLSPQVQLALAGAVNPTDDQILLAGERACFTAPEDLIVQIDELENKYQAAHKLGMAHTPRAAGDAFHAYSEGLSAHVLSSESVAKCEGKTREDFEAEFRHKLKSAFKLASTYGPKARELLQSHFYRYTSLVRELADQLASNEQSVCMSLGLSWVPSNHVVMLYKCAAVVEERAGRGHSPKECASFLHVLKK